MSLLELLPIHPETGLWQLATGEISAGKEYSVIIQIVHWTSFSICTFIGLLKPGLSWFHALFRNLWFNLRYKVCVYVCVMLWVYCATHSKCNTRCIKQKIFTKIWSENWVMVKEWGKNRRVEYNKWNVQFYPDVNIISNQISWMDKWHGAGQWKGEASTTLPLEHLHLGAHSGPRLWLGGAGANGEHLEMWLQNIPFFEKQ